MTIDFSDKTVVITGAGGAIGGAMAYYFAQSGAKAAVCDVNEKSGRETAGKITKDGYTAEFFYLDVTDKGSIKKALDDIVHKFGGVDVFINNAGVNVPAQERFNIDGFSDEWWEKIISIDLDGVYNCSKAAVPHVQKSGGSIINISSVIGMVAFRNQCAFTAAKAGVIHLTKAMAVELADRGVRVNCIAPGSIVMDLTKSLWANEELKKAFLSHIPQHRQGSPEDIAKAALFLADNNSAGYITGQVLAVDGGWLCGYARDF